MHKDWLKHADIITEALPFIRRYVGRNIVIKFGGSAMNDDTTLKHFAEDVSMLHQVGVKPIIVHGGGPKINHMLKKLNLKLKFDNGLRVTDQHTMDVAEMVLCGSINNQLTAHINATSGLAVGLNGKDANLITVKKVERTVRDPDSHIEKVVDLGFVGDPTHIDTKILDVLINSNFIPVIAPIGLGRDKKTYNINADTCAGAIAVAMRAKRLILLTDVPGLFDKEKTLIKAINIAGLKRLMRDKTVLDGMIPKVATCIDSIEKGVESAVIADGNLRHAILLEIFTEGGAGTLIKGL